MSWKWLDPVFVLRPTLFFPCWTLFLAGARASDVAGGDSWWRIVSGMAVTGAAMGVIYLVNQLRDVGTDRINQKLPYFAKELFSVRFAWWEVYILMALSVLSAAAVSWTFLAIVVGALLVTGGMYNYPPFDWKDLPVGGIVVALLGGFLAFVAGSAAVNGLSWAVAAAAIPYLLAFVATSLWTAIPDMSGDRAMGKRTFAVQYGMTATLVVGCLGVAAAAVLGFLFHDWVIGWSALLSLPFFIYALVKSQVRAVLLAVKWSIFILSLLIGWCYPGYLVLMAAYYILARVYHRRRFGVTYPSLVFDTEEEVAEEGS
jgi:4-hydroxybenzoate polyprenyltransferase